MQSTLLRRALSLAASAGVIALVGVSTAFAQSCPQSGQGSPFTRYTPFLRNSSPFPGDGACPQQQLNGMDGGNSDCPFSHIRRFQQPHQGNMPPFFQNGMMSPFQGMMPGSSSCPNGR